MAPGLMEAVAPTAPPPVPDLDRMRRERTQRVRDAMRRKGIDALILLGNTNVTYATGVVWPLADGGRAGFERPVAVVVADDESPHLFSPIREDDRLRAHLPRDHVHGPAYLDFDEGVRDFVAALRGLIRADAVIVMDEWTHAMQREQTLLFASEPVDGGRVMSSVKLLKTPDEVSCMREGLRITEQGMAEVQARIAPGVRQTELTATFLRTIFDAGADANVLDPIWQVMPTRVEDGPWTTTGDLACPLLSTERKLEEGDVLWVDTGISYGGYHSDFGRTWIVGREPSDRQQAQYRRWREISDAVTSVLHDGVTAAELTAVARELYDGEQPWMAHFYLGHGLGLDSAEAPYVGTDLGDDYDRGLVLAAGTVVVIEPIVWDEGHGGYRSENVFVVTDDGCVNLTDYSYAPHGD